MNTWQYGGRKVFVPPAADVSLAFRQDEKLGAAVQEVLDETSPWTPGSDPIETMTFDLPFPAIVIPIADHRLIWGIHAEHHARQPGLSPFIRVDSVPITYDLTIELAGTPNAPMLVRAYPGDYIPPLPWMKTAGSADGGRDACLDFWRSHAYLYRQRLVKRRSQVPPRWF